MWTLSKHGEHFEEFKLVKLTRFKKFFLDGETIHRCEAWTPTIRVTALGDDSVCRNGKDSLVRIVLPYHGCLERIASRHVKLLQARVRLCLQPLMKAAGGLKVQIAWKSFQKPLSQTLRSIGAVKSQL